VTSNKSLERKRKILKMLKYATIRYNKSRRSVKTLGEELQINNTTKTFQMASEIGVEEVRANWC
jgi:hypothetical protein